MCVLSLEKEPSLPYFPLMYVFLLKKADSRSASVSVTYIRVWTFMQSVCSCPQFENSNLNFCFTFRYGMQAVRMASTVKSERANPTKYICSGRRPSLNNHLGQKGETWEIRSLHQLPHQIRVIYFISLCCAVDVEALNELRGSLTIESDRFSS